MTLSDDQDHAPRVTLRIPGKWTSLDDFEAALPHGVRCDDHWLHMPDGAKFELRASEADQEFPQVFLTSCTREVSPQDRAGIESYTVNVVLTGHGGSIEAARRLLKAGAAVVRAGGFGVFCDASGAAHGSDDWLTLADTDDDGGAYWAFVATTGDEHEIHTTGMHVLGCRDATMARSGDDQHDWIVLNNFLGYTYLSGATIADGDLLGDEDPDRPEFRVHTLPCTRFEPSVPFHNPYGMWRLERLHQTDRA